MSDAKILRHLRRIEGQVKGIQRMVTEERPCDEVLTQIMAIKAALDRVTTDLAQASLSACSTEWETEAAQAQMARTLSLLCKR